MGPDAMAEQGSPNTRGKNVECRTPKKDGNVTKEEERKDAVQKERLGRLVKKEGKDAVQRRPRKIAQNSRSLKQINKRSPKRSACLK